MEKLRNMNMNTSPTDLKELFNNSYKFFNLNKNPQKNLENLANLSSKNCLS